MMLELNTEQAETIRDLCALARLAKTGAVSNCENVSHLLTAQDERVLLEIGSISGPNPHATYRREWTNLYSASGNNVHEAILAVRGFVMKDVSERIDVHSMTIVNSLTNLLGWFSKSEKFGLNTCAQREKILPKMQELLHVLENSDLSLSELPLPKEKKRPRPRPPRRGI